MTDPDHQFHQNLRIVEALLFALSEPASESVLAAQLPEGTDLGAVMAELQSHYEGRGVHLVKVAGKWALRTASDLGEKLQVERTQRRKLSRAAMETLAIVAYHQPVTRAEIEEVRGRALSPGTMEILLENEWVQPKGRRQTPGRPVTWGTTDLFLQHFQLASIDDLPGIDELKAAGLLDTRAARLVTQGNLSANPNELAEREDAEADDENGLDEPLDPDGEETAGPAVAGRMERPPHKAASVDDALLIRDQDEPDIDPDADRGGPVESATTAKEDAVHGLAAKSAD